jgi:hypothetical protein
MRRFRSFVRLFYSFAESLSDREFDSERWRAKRVARGRLEAA